MSSARFLRVPRTSDARSLNVFGVVFSQVFNHSVDFVGNRICCEVQKDDRFVDLLNGIRTGENRGALEVIAGNCSRSLRVANGIRPTVLYPR